jgi:RNA polymerase sigma-70 factor (ECF subfamily)
MGLDPDRLLRLLLAQRGMLIGYIHAIVRDPHLAEDIFQDVSLIVMRKGGVLESEAAFPGWIRKTARFEAMNALRKYRKGTAALDDGLLDTLEGHWEAADAAEPRREVEALQKCIETLTPKVRKLVELRYRENLVGEKLAETLAQPLNTVYVALSRAHRRLGDCVRARLAGGTG